MNILVRSGNRRSVTEVLRWMGTGLALASLLCGIPVRATGLLVQKEQPPQRKRVLILGDSISMGYTPFVTQELADLAIVTRPQLAGKAENCNGTTYGVANVDRWLSEAGPVDLIFFNFGLHDLKHVQLATGKNSDRAEDPRQAEPDTYRRQLSKIVNRIETTGARLVFVTTTPVPPGGVKPFRSVGDSLHYNAIARDVVEPRGIEVLDLYQPALDHQQEWQLPANVHFSKTGSAALAALVAQTARRQLNQACPDWSIAKQPWTADPATVERLGASGEFNYRESAVPKFELPHVFDTGTTKTAADWQRERPGLVGRFADIIYGRAPPQLANASCLFTSRMMEAPDGVRPMTIREITVVIGAKEDPLFSFPFLLFQPPGSGPFPSIVLIHNREYPDVTRALQSPTGFLPVEMLIERGFAVAVFHTSQVEPDRADAAGDGIREACRLRFGDDRTRPDYWGCLTAWAWGASRVAEYLASQPEFDPEKIAVIGHSRGGKTALWAAAGDQRFAAAISNESGCAGAALSRRAYGETIGRISTVFPYWFAPRFAEYAGRENELPLDQHQLIGLIAPRCVAIGSAAEDLWADPRGEYLALVNAGPAFGRFGLESIHEQEMPATGETRIRGRTCYHVRAGSHNLTESDWIRYLEFLEIQGHKAPPN